MNIYRFGFVSKNSNDYLINNIINLHYFYKKYEAININAINMDLFNSSPEIIKLLHDYLSEDRTLLLHNFIMTNYIENYNFNKIQFFYKKIYILFKNSNKISLNPPKLIIDRTSYNFSIDNIDYNKKLLLRTGIVELYIVNAFLYGDKSLIKKALQNIINNYNNEQYMYNQYRECWMTITHSLNQYETYLKLVMTNAGFYIDNNLENAFINLEFFVNKYKECIINCDYLMHYDFLNSYSFDILNEKKQFKKLNFYEYNPYFINKILNNKSVLLLTPFKNKIDKIYNEGNITKVRNDINFNSIDLVTIESFLTTYPNKTHTCFKETFEYYCNKIDEEFTKKNFDIFTCSVGCYGILLCDYVYKKYNVTSFYAGNAINAFFGITCNQFGTDNEFCEKSDLNDRYKNIDKIENNMYGSKI